MKNKKAQWVYKPIFIFVYLAFVSVLVEAQVTMGSSKPPENFSILEVVSNKGGIRYPQLEQTAIEALQLNPSTKPYGLLVYNNTSKALQFFSSSNSWIKLNQKADDDLGVPASISYTSFSTSALEVTNLYQFAPSTNASVTGLKIGCLLDPYQVFKSATSTAPNATTGQAQISVVMDKAKIDALTYSPGTTLSIQCFANYKINGIAKSITFIVDFDK